MYRMYYVILEASELLWQLAINKFKIKIINRLIKYLIKLYSVHKYLRYNKVIINICCLLKGNWIPSKILTTKYYLTKADKLFVQYPIWFNKLYLKNVKVAWFYTTHTI